MRKQSRKDDVAVRRVRPSFVKMSLGQKKPPKVEGHFTQNLDFCYALTTLPDLRQDVQTRTRLDAPFTIARTGRRFTFQRRLLTL
jgi:hypothetical protein